MHRPSLAAVLVASLAIVAAGTAGCAGQAQAGVLRLGYFPNLTHAQPLYGVESGLYQRHLGATHLETQSFNAGPTAFEALLAGRIDVIYVGPSPTISALETSGDLVQIVAGSASGGASFVVRDQVSIQGDGDLGGKRFASPQLGNTQDVALKHYLLEHGHKIRSQGGDVDVINAANPDILVLFQKGDIDGAWLPEPWATRLVTEGGGKVLVDERDLWPDGKFVVTHVVTTRSFLASHHDDVVHLLQAHIEATSIVQKGGADVQATINDAIQAMTGNRLKDATLAAALPHVDFTTEPLPETFLTQYRNAHDLGVVAEAPADVARFYDLGPLQEARSIQV